jgi:hypothetical protein
MDPLTMMALAQTGLGLFQSVTGGGLLASAKRPEYKRPQEANTALAIAQARAQSDMPGLSRNLDQNALAAANAISASTQGGRGIEVAPVIQAQQQQANAAAFTRNAQYKDQSLANYQRQLAVSANYADTEFQMNKFAPYMDKVTQGKTLLGGGLQNAFSGFGKMSGYMNMEQAINQVEGQAISDAEKAFRIQQIQSQYYNSVR